MVTMRSLALTLFIVCAGALFPSCDQNSVRPTPLTSLDVKVVGGFVTANLMPIVEPDPLYCRLTLSVRNTSSDGSFYGLGVREGTVFLDADHATLGRFRFTSDWDGRLAPGETDTVHLTKLASSFSGFTPPCGARVGISFAVEDFARNALPVTADSLPVLCVY